MTGSQFTPLRLSVAWLGGTFVLFLLVGRTDEVENLPTLTAFVGATIAALVAGYWIRIVRYRSTAAPDQRGGRSEADVANARTLVVLSAAYYAVYGIVYMRNFGVASPGALLSALRDPGGAYLARFGVQDAQVALGQTSLAAQILTLVAVLAAPLVPFLILYWHEIGIGSRLFAFIGLGLFAGFYIAIGTLSGLGNLLIFATAGVMVARAQGRTFIGGQHPRVITAMLGILGLVLAGYMAYNQGTRVQAVGLRGDVEPNPVASALVGDRAFAQGVTVTLSYPTHGYQGLAYNLETPFVWTHGRGASRAFDSYLAQYGFGESVFDQTFPARTELRTGWPSGRYWATIYPWLASDLHWPGVLVFMFGVGWWLARWWYEAVVLGRQLSVLLFAQLGLLLAFVPANNQIGLSRPNLIGFLTLLALYVARRKSYEQSRRQAGRPDRIGAHLG